MPVNNLQAEFSFVYYYFFIPIFYFDGSLWFSIILIFLF